MAHFKLKIKTSTSLDQKLSKKGKAPSRARVTSWARSGQQDQEFGAYDW